MNKKPLIILVCAMALSGIAFFTHGCASSVAPTVLPVENENQRGVFDTLKKAIEQIGKDALGIATDFDKN